MTDPIASIRAAVTGRYEIGREIGQGAFATVYLARDLRHERRVAFKVLNADPDSELGELRFLREIRLLANLQHPNILPLIDSGHAGSMLYYVMPYVSGEALRLRMQRERQLPVEAALGIAREVADALACAHSHGIVHRDIKPENILLSAGHPMLADFGVARAIGTTGVRHLTRTGSGMPGTPSYMSPEQLLNESEEVDGRSDTYSLGCVLYEMLTGMPPFAGKDGFVRRFTEPPPRPSVVRHGLPAEVDAVVTKALSRAPDERYAAGDLCRALERTLVDISAHPNSATPIDSPAVRTHVPRAIADAGSPAEEHNRPEPDVSSWHVRLGRRSWLVAGGTVLLAAIIAPAIMGRDHIGRGRRALDAGRIDAAITELRQVPAGDPAFATASLWLAQALLMNGQDTAVEARRASRAAGSGAGHMMMNDALRAQALDALATRRYAVACDAFSTLHAMLPDDTSITFSLAECISRDSIVVRDSASLSGWRFRGDWNGALTLYKGLLEHLPPGHDTRRVILAHMPRLLTTEWGKYRRGYSVDDSTKIFGAFPSLQEGIGGGEVIYEPHPLAEFRPGRTWMNPPSMERAWEHDRAVLQMVGEASVVEEPSSAVAHATLASALELKGQLDSVDANEGSALRDIITARRLARSGADSLRYRGAEIRLLVKSGDFEGAAVRAESTLAAWPHPDHAALEVLAPLAALTGHARLLAGLLAHDAEHNVQRMPDGRSFLPHPVLGATTLALSAYAKVGGPRDSIVALASRAERQIRSYAAPRAVDSVRSALLSRSISLAVPVLGAEAVLGLPHGDALLEAQRFRARGDMKGVRAALDSLMAFRSGHVAAAARLEQVYQEAWLRASIGDTNNAVAVLDDALNGMPALGTLFLVTQAEAGAVAPAMQLRAKLAERTSDSASAQRWSAAALSLRRNADNELRPR